tara:strand:+ start:215 stop:562 length:348 start_codon:yes stop_codon:yes gene_type:complete
MKLGTKKGYELTRELKIPVEKCVIRLCRGCGNAMSNMEYEWDSENRWYNFFCEVCGYRVTLSESISQDFLDDDFEHEPLTSKEKVDFGIMSREFEKKQKWEYYELPSEDYDEALK